MMVAQEGSVHPVVVILQTAKNSLAFAVRVRLILKPAFVLAIFRSKSDLSDFMTHKLVLCVVAVVSGKGRINWVTLRICYVSEQDQSVLGREKKFKPKRTEYVLAC